MVSEISTPRLSHDDLLTTQMWCTTCRVSETQCRHDLPRLTGLVLSLSLQRHQTPLQPLQLQLFFLCLLTCGCRMRLCLCQLLFQKGSLLGTQLQLLLILNSNAEMSQWPMSQWPM